MPEPLDLELVNELREIMEDEFPSLLATFLSESERQYQQAKRALASNDMEQLRRAAHALKGSCGNVGALELHAMCGDIEQRARANQLSDMETLLSQAEIQLQAVCAAVRTL